MRTETTNVRSLRRARGADRQPPDDGRRRIVVLASDLAGAVETLGGWMYDQVKVGWTVVVPVPHPVDDRPLRILGATLAELDAFLAAPVRARQAGIVAADAAWCDADDRVRRYVAGAAGDLAVDVRLWNEGHPGVHDGVVQPLPHRLSHAARAFKVHAVLAATGVRPGTAAAIETVAVAPHPAARRGWPLLEPLGA